MPTGRSGVLTDVQACGRRGLNPAQRKARARRAKPFPWEEFLEMEETEQL